MSRDQKTADDLMLKASEAFAAGKMQKAYKLYGRASDAYRDVPDAPQERRALALYTRAMFILCGDATGRVEEDLDAGDALVSGTDFSGRERFRGLFRCARARWRRQHDDLDEADRLLQEAESLLTCHGTPVDRLELFREMTRLCLEQRDWERAESAARKAVEESPDARQALEARTLLAEVFRAQGRMAEVLEVLELAASEAYDLSLKDELWDLQDRIEIIRRNHPELQ